MCLAPLPICIFKKWVRTSHAAFLLALISKSSTCLVSEPHTLLQKNYGCRRQGTLKIQSINYGSSELFVTEGSLYFPVTGCKYKWKNNSKFNYSPPPRQEYTDVLTSRGTLSSLQSWKRCQEVCQKSSGGIPFPPTHGTHMVFTYKFFSNEAQCKSSD